MPIMAMIVGATDLFVYCFFGKLATDSHTNMANCLYECNWSDLSTEHQRVLIVMIANMQTPLFYHGFGMATLNLETFIKVNPSEVSEQIIRLDHILYFFLQYIKTVYTFYMMFKTLSE